MARARLHRTLRVLTLALAAACSSAPPPAPRSAPEPAPQPKAERPDARRKLLAALREVERPGPILGALPAEATKALEQQLAALAPAQRADLQKGTDGLDELLPLLHLAAGGESPRALFALATTPRAAESVPALIGESKLAIVAEVARRAGLHFLRDRTLDVAAPPSTTAELCRAIEQVASALGRRDLVRLSRELWVTLDPAPAVWLRVARSRALDLDVAGAREALAQAGNEPAGTVPKLVDAAASLGAVPAAELEPALARARAQIALERWSEAIATLEPHRAAADTHLGVAAALSLAETHGSTCPGLPPGVGTRQLCAAAWAADPTVERALARLERAFESKAGRDPEALETYLGLVHIVPWIHATSGESGLDAGSAARAFGPRLSALKAALAQAPHLAHVGLFVEALELGYRASAGRKPNEPPQIPKAAKDALRARALAERAPVARLAVAAILAAEEDVADLVVGTDAAGLTASQKEARAGLLAWVAASDAHPELAEQARAALGERVFELGDDPLARAQTVLLLAEFDAIRDGSERGRGVLAKVATELISGSVTPELGLRAVLDAAGALVASGRADDARAILERAQGVTPPPGASTELMALIRARRAVLEAERGPASEIAARKREIAEMAANDPPPGVALALASCLKRIEALEAEARCERSKAPRCAERAAALRRQLPKDVTGRVPVGTIELLQKRGVLRTTRAGLRLGYAPETGVTPEVSFEPSFLKLE